MLKRWINRPVFSHKIIFFSILILLIGTIVGVMYMFQLPTVTSSTETLLHYTQQGAFTYEVYLRPNLLFDDLVIQGENGGQYFTDITDHIDVHFTYQFLSDESATVTGILEITGALRSVSSRDGLLWTKDLNLSNPSVTFQGAEVALDIPIDLEFLYDLAQRIEREIKVSSPENQVILTARLFTIANTEAGVINESFEKAMTLSLGTNVIKIESMLTKTQPGTIEHVNSISFPWINNWRLGSLIVLASMIMVTSYYVPLYRQHAKQDKARPDNVVKGILKKYDETIVQTRRTTLPENAETTFIAMSSIDDLLKISEQSYKPIIYTEQTIKPTSPHRTHLFYVQDDNVRYEMWINEHNPPWEITDKLHPTAPSQKRFTIATLKTIGYRIVPHLLLALGIVAIIGASWLTWYELTTIGRDLTAVFVVPLPPVLDLGLGLRIIHYLGIGVACCLAGIVPIVTRRHPITTPTTV